MRKLALLVIAACNPETSIRPDGDANTTVKHVDFSTASPSVAVMTVGLASDRSPSQITAGQVVEFVITPQRNVFSTTSGLAVDYGATTCLAFPEPGTYTFKCATHGFVGTVIVSP